MQFSASADNAADLFEAATTLEVSREDVQLWWPAGGNYGPHKLYDVTIKFEPLGAWCAPSAEAHTRPERGQLFEDPFFSVGGGSDSGGIGIGLDLSDGFKAAINIGDLFDFNINVSSGSESLLPRTLIYQIVHIVLPLGTACCASLPPLITTIHH